MSVSSAIPPRGLPGATRVGSPDARATTSFATALQTSLATPPTVEVARVATPLTGNQAARALANAWQQRFGHAPTREQLSLLLSQWSLETGGGASMVGFNFGGLKGKSPSGLTVAYKTTEGYGATETHSVKNFRAYQNADEGARDYLDVLIRRFPEAVEQVKAGDPAAFVRELKKAGYFTGSEEVYSKNVRSLFREAMSSGFDALGASKTTAPSALAAVPLTTSTPRVQPLGFPSSPSFASGFPLGGNSGAQASFADSLAFADELARVATRIAGPTSEDRDDDPTKLRT